MRRWLVLALCGSFTATAQAQERDMAARQAVGLFQQACISQFGDIAKVRAFLEDKHVPHASEGLTRALLAGRPGMVYDASNPTGRYAVVAQTDGLCTVAAPQAKAADVIPELEEAIKGLGMTIYLLQNRAGVDPRLHHRDYLLVHNGVDYNLVASTAEGGQWEAILSFSRRGADEPIPSPLPRPQ
jgi:hypothetical protein